MKDLINTIPFLRSSIPDPVRYFDTEYRRFTQMSKMGLFELVPTWSSEQGNTVCSVALVEQDQPTIVETGRAGAWVCYEASPTKINSYLTQLWSAF